MAVPNPWPAFWAAKKMNEERQKYDAYDRYELDEAPVPQALFAASLILLASAYIGGMGYVLYKCFAPEKTDKAEKTEYVTPIPTTNSLRTTPLSPDEMARELTKLREHYKTR